MLINHSAYFSQQQLTYSKRVLLMSWCPVLSNHIHFHDDEYGYRSSNISWVCSDLHQEYNCKYTCSLITQHISVNKNNSELILWVAWCSVSSNHSHFYDNEHGYSPSNLSCVCSHLHQEYMETKKSN